MGYKITILEQALHELDEAIEWYWPISNLLANNLLQDYYSTLNEIGKGPFQFEKTDKKYRKHNLRKFPYKVVYQLKNNEIIVIAFAHHKRKPGYWKNR